MKQYHLLISDEFEGAELFTNALVEYYNLEIINIRELLRITVTLNDSLSLQIRSYLENGEQIPNKFVNELIEQDIQKTESNILIKRYPRTNEQFNLLVELLRIKNIQINSIWYLKLINIDSYSEDLYLKNKDFNNKYEITTDSIKSKILKSANQYEHLVEYIEKSNCVKTLEYDNNSNWNIETLITKIKSYT